MIEFKVRGEPKALKRHRTGVIYGRSGKPVMKNGRVITHNYDPSAEDKKDFLAAVQNNAPDKFLEGALYLECHLWFKRPKNHYGTGRNAGHLKETAPIFHTSVPDSSNIVKFIEDAFKNIYFDNDSQISVGLGIKKYANDYPFVHVKLMEVSEWLKMCGSVGGMRNYNKQLVLL